MPLPCPYLQTIISSFPKLNSSDDLSLEFFKDLSSLRISKEISLMLKKKRIRVGDMTQLVEHQPIKHSALSSNPSAAERKRKCIDDYTFKL
jgi:hypothetical protein